MFFYKAESERQVPACDLGWGNCFRGRRSGDSGNESAEEFPGQKAFKVLKAPVSYTHLKLPTD